jgi:hypothetical protein
MQANEDERRLTDIATTWELHGRPASGTEAAFEAMQCLACLLERKENAVAAKHMHLRAAEALVLLELASCEGHPALEATARRRMAAVRVCMDLVVEEARPGGSGSSRCKHLRQQIAELTSTTRTAQVNTSDNSRERRGLKRRRADMDSEKENQPS